MRLALRFRATVFVFSVVAVGGHAITLGQVDDFQDGTLQGWSGGTSLTNRPNGGPNGAGDRYLEVESFGGSGPGSNMATFNTNQWSGNYIAANVKAVQVHMKNFSNTPLHMRVVVFGQGGSRWTSKNEYTHIIPANSDWVRLTFFLTEDSLMRVLGSEDYATVMSNNRQLMFRHDPVGSSGGSPIAAVLGIDNITASTTISPSAFSVLTGVLSSGNLQSLQFQDEDRLIVRESPPLALGLPSVDVRVDGVSPISSASSMMLRVVLSTTAVPATAVNQVVQMFNFQANVFETVDTRAATGGDNVIYIRPTGDPSRFIQSGTNLVRMRVRWFDPGTLFAFGWRGRINQVVWATAP